MTTNATQDYAQELDYAPDDESIGAIQEIAGDLLDYAEQRETDTPKAGELTATQLVRQERALAIRDLTIKQGLTARQVAEVVGLHPATVRDYLNEMGGEIAEARAKHMAVRRDTLAAELEAIAENLLPLALGAIDPETGIRATPRRTDIQNYLDVTRELRKLTGLDLEKGDTGGTTVYNILGADQIPGLQGTPGTSLPPPPAPDVVDHEPGLLEQHLLESATAPNRLDTYTPTPPEPPLNTIYDEDPRAVVMSENGPNNPPMA